MKKVIILSLHLGYGGIEKSIVALANILCEKYKVEIIAIGNGTASRETESFIADVIICSLSNNSALASNLLIRLQIARYGYPIESQNFIKV